MASRALDAAELFMLQILVDLDARDDAARLADDLLSRHPGLQLDPAEFSPAVQRLWNDARERRSRFEAAPPERSALIDLGRRLGADWVFAATWVARDEIAVTCVRLTGAGGDTVVRVELGPRAGWAGAIGAALGSRFPRPRVSYTAPRQQPGGGSDGRSAGEEDRDKWYRRWWFWTAVGVALVGGAAGGIGAAVTSAGEGRDPAVTMGSDVWGGG